MNSDIIGHKQVLDFFDKVIENNNLSHAYCFVGPQNVGKTRVAEEVGAKLLKIETSKLKIIPDFIVVRQGTNEKTGKTKKNIDIEQMRELREALGRYAFLGGYKVAVIDKADKMNSSAANALLKTLEEPTAKTILILLTKDSSLLPETIQSRCQMINFQPVEKNAIQNYLQSNGLEENKAEEMARLSRGLPGSAIRWLENEEDYNQYKQEVLRFESLLGQPFYKKLEKVDDLFGDKSDHIAARKKLQSVLNIWQLVLRDKMCDLFNLEDDKIHQFKSKIKFDKKSVLNIYNSIGETKLMLNQNIHPRLAVEQILLILP